MGFRSRWHAGYGTYFSWRDLCTCLKLHWLYCIYLKVFHRHHIRCYCDGADAVADELMQLKFDKIVTYLKEKGYSIDLNQLIKTADMYHPSDHHHHPSSIINHQSSIIHHPSISYHYPPPITASITASSPSLIHCDHLPIITDPTTHIHLNLWSLMHDQILWFGSTTSAFREWISVEPRCTSLAINVMLSIKGLNGSSNTDLLDKNNRWRPSDYLQKAIPIVFSSVVQQLASFVFYCYPA